MKNNVMGKAVKKWHGVVLILAVFALFGAFNKAQADNSGVNGGVRATAVLSSDKIIIGGDFTSYNGAPANRIACLNQDGALDSSSFNIGSGLNGSVSSIAIQGGNMILVAGNFTTYNDVPVKHIIRLKLDGSLDDTFDADITPSTSISSISVQPSDNKIIIAGHIIDDENIPPDGNGWPNRHSLARLNVNGSRDSFVPSFSWWSPSTALQILNNPAVDISTVAVQSDGKIWVGVNANISFNANGRYGGSLVRLNTDGNLDISPGISNLFSVVSIRSVSDDKTLVVYRAGGSYEERLIRLYADGTIDMSFNPVAGVSIRTMDTQQGGKIIIGGYFANYNGTTANNIARLDSDGTLDTTFNSTTTPPSTEKFVYIALGDSYQSGEGAGNSAINTEDYLNAYEKGTYTPEVIDGGDACHRSLANYAQLISYAKNSRDRLKPEIPDKDIVLIDVTCSGATIEKDIDGQLSADDKHTVVGNAGSASYDPSSQVALAIAQLPDGLTENDVDLVTVGMGGNDAKFGDIVKACVVPNLVRYFLDNYTSGGVVGERGLILDRINLSTCEQTVEKYFPIIDDEIKALPKKEIWAQNILLSEFQNARILQLNYPNILPKLANSAPSWCGGIRKEDLEYANRRVRQINGAVEASVYAINNPRLQLVNIANAFGNDALCTGNLANGINKDNFIAEADRLMADKNVESLYNLILADYDVVRACTIYSIAWYPFFPCDAKSLTAKVEADVKDLTSYLGTQSMLKPIMANLAVKPSPGADDEGIRYDHYQGLFHPNANGFAIMACYVRRAFNHQYADDCYTAKSPLADMINGNNVSNAPISSEPGSEAHIQMSGFSGKSLVKITFHSTSIDLGTVMSDDAGNVDVNITLPQAGAGVHTLELEGNTQGGVGISKRVRVSYPGRPSGGGSYATYSCGFTPNLDDTLKPEQVDITYYGENFGTVTPDEDGCVFIELPLFGLPGNVDITARSQTTGKSVTTTIDPIPSDTIAPTTTPSIAGTQGQNGWYVSAATVTIDAKDNDDGVTKTMYSLDDGEWQIYSSTSSIEIAAEGIHTLQYYSSDLFKNQEATETLEIKIDKTAPEITTDVPAEGYILNSQANANWTLTDNLSGVDGDTHGTRTVDTSSVGPKSFTVTATDLAGNSDTKTVKYKVIYVFGGFLFPVDKDNKMFNSNSTIPVKFQLADASGKYISGATASLMIDDDKIKAVASGGSYDGNKFKYDASANQYIFNLSVKNTLLKAGTYKLTIMVDDGTTQSQSITIK